MHMGVPSRNPTVQALFGDAWRGLCTLSLSFCWLTIPGTALFWQWPASKTEFKREEPSLLHSYCSYDLPIFELNLFSINGRVTLVDFIKFLLRFDFHRSSFYTLTYRTSRRTLTHAWTALRNLSRITLL